MKGSIQLDHTTYQVDYSRPLDLSLPIQATEAAATAWYCPAPTIEPVRTEQFTGSVAEGGAVNFRNVFFNPHGNGTHTECFGHISKDWQSINQHLKQFVFGCMLVSLTPSTKDTDAIIHLNALKTALAPYDPAQATAIAIRTLPNTPDKQYRQYSNTNPPYVSAEGLAWLYDWGIRHLLIDTPSVDREFDDGVLAAHHAFWNYPDAPRTEATITELIYAPNTIADGLYLLHLQVAAFENDAAPSRPVLYALEEV